MENRDRVQPRDFFRRRLLALTSYEELRQFLGDLSSEQRELRRSVADMMWHMRGSLSREEAWTLSLAERDDIRRLIEERMKIVEKTNLALL